MQACYISTHMQRIGYQLYLVMNHALQTLKHCRDATFIRILYYTVGCIENTQTQSLDSCDENGCRCKEGFAPPDCCDCDVEGLSGRIHYIAPDGTCKRECMI